MGVLAELALYSILLVAHCLFMSNYKGCQLPLDIMMVILFSSLIWTRLFICLYNEQIIRIVSAVAFVIGTVVCVLATTSSLVFLILIEVYYSKCMPLNLKVFDWVIVGLGNLLVILAVLASIVLYIRFKNDERQTQQMQIECEEIYQKVYDVNFDAQSYLAAHSDVIDERPFSPNEKIILNENCQAKYSEDQNSIEEGNKQECTICIAELKKGQTVLRHPICCHYFHDGCIKPWLNQNLHCPLCKRGTRSSLILQLSKTRKGIESISCDSSRLII